MLMVARPSEAKQVEWSQENAQESCLQQQDIPGNNQQRHIVEESGAHTALSLFLALALLSICGSSHAVATSKRSTVTKL